MNKANASGYSLTQHDAKIVLGMVLRGDRHHDIAAWFGVNQGRVAEVSKGEKFPSISAASTSTLPPKGPPGIKGRILQETVSEIVAMVENGDLDLPQTISKLKIALSKYNSHEL